MAEDATKTKLKCTLFRIQSWPFDHISYVLCLTVRVHPLKFWNEINFMMTGNTICVGVGVRVAQSKKPSKCTRNTPFTSTMKRFALVFASTLKGVIEVLLSKLSLIRLIASCRTIYSNLSIKCIKFVVWYYYTFRNQKSIDLFYQTIIGKAVCTGRYLPPWNCG